MAVRELLANNFSGGVQFGEEPGEFTETQWKELSGFVFDDERRLRTQWAQHVLRTTDNVARVGEVGGFILAILDDGVEYREEPTLGAAPGSGGWSTVQDGGSAFTFGGNPTPRSLTKVPERDGAGGFTEGLLLNTVAEAQDEAYILTVDGGAVVPKALTERYPTGPEVDDAMPYAEVGTMWGSFLVLGDIRWADDPDDTISPSNSAQYPYGLWFSQPNSVTNFDPIDVEFISTHTGTGRIVGMFPLDVGLVVLAEDGVHLFRGNPANYSYEVVRTDIGCPSPGAATYWAHANVVAWLDEAGSVWHTNGEEVTRIDLPLPPAEGPQRGLTAWYDKLVVRRGGVTWVFHAFEEGGAWTRLRRTPVCTECDAKATQAFYWRNFETGALVRFDPVAPRDVTETSRVVSRPLGEAHRRTFWHRAGIRHRGGGEPTVITWIINRGESVFSAGLDRVGVHPGSPGPLPMAMPYPFAAEDVEEAFLPALRGGGVVPAPGPAQEVLVQADFVGDVTLESMSLWFHEGRSER